MPLQLQWLSIGLLACGKAVGGSPPWTASGCGAGLDVSAQVLGRTRPSIGVPAL